MSETTIFIIGAIVFAITVWGAVAAGGLAFTQLEMEQNPELKQRVDDDRLKPHFPPE